LRSLEERLRCCTLQGGNFFPLLGSPDCFFKAASINSLQESGASLEPEIFELSCLRRVLDCLVQPVGLGSLEECFASCKSERLNRVSLSCLCCGLLRLRVHDGFLKLIALCRLEQRLASCKTKRFNRVSLCLSLLRPHPHDGFLKRIALCRLDECVASFKPERFNRVSLSWFRLALRLVQDLGQSSAFRCLRKRLP